MDIELMKLNKRIFGKIQILNIIWFNDKILKILECSEILF